MISQTQPDPRLIAPDEPSVAALLWGLGCARARRALVGKRRIVGLPLLVLGARRGLVKMPTNRAFALPWGAAGLSFDEVPSLDSTTRATGTPLVGAPSANTPREQTGGWLHSHPSSSRVSGFTLTLLLVHRIRGQAEGFRASVPNVLGLNPALYRRPLGWNLASTEEGSERSLAVASRGGGSSPDHQQKRDTHEADPVLPNFDSQTDLPQRPASNRPSDLKAQNSLILSQFSTTQPADGSPVRFLRSSRNLEGLAPASLLFRSLCGAGAGSRTPAATPCDRTPATFRHPLGWSFAIQLTTARPSRAAALQTKRSANVLSARTAELPQRERAVGRPSVTGLQPLAFGMPTEDFSDAVSATLARGGATSSGSPRQRDDYTTLPWSVPLPLPSNRVTAIPNRTVPDQLPQRETPAAAMTMRTSRSARTALDRLPQRDTRAAPVTMKSLVEVTDSLRTFVVNEVREAKAAMSRLASPVPPVAHEMPIALTDDAARKLLSRMKTIMQEERFRSGRLR